jgi:hypothetical protein
LGESECSRDATLTTFVMPLGSGVRMETSRSRDSRLDIDITDRMHAYDSGFWRVGSFSCDMVPDFVIGIFGGKILIHPQSPMKGSPKAHFPRRSVV